MKNTEHITYTRLEKGNLIVLVPNEQEEWAQILGHRILWSLKEFEGKVFSEMNEKFVLENILQQRLLRGESIYDIEISLFEDGWINEQFEVHMKDYWEYFTMKQTYRYYDAIIAQYTGDQKIDGLISHVGWSNNTKESISVKALNSQVDFKKGVMFSSFNKYSEMLFEELITKYIAKCDKIGDNYIYGAPTGHSHIFKYHGEIKIDVADAFFIFKNENVYCGISSDEDIVVESSWDHYINEVYKNNKDRHLVCTIQAPQKSLQVFTDVNVSERLPDAIQKTIYSTDMQIIQIIKECKEVLYQKYTGLTKIFFTTEYKAKDKYIKVLFLDKNWEKIHEKEIKYETDIEYFINNNKSVFSNLSQ